MSSPLIDKLAAEGWEKQFSVSGPRLEEALETYKSLGYETKTVPMTELECGDCNICFEDSADKSVMIFTRKTGKLPEEDLF